MTRFAHLVAFAFFLNVAALSGCHAPEASSPLESEARALSGRIRHLEKELAKTEKLLAQQDRQLQALRSQRPRTSTSASGIRSISATAEESVTAWAAVSSLGIHRLTSGLVGAGDTLSFRVVVQPLDEDMEVTKVSGTLRLSIAHHSSEGRPLEIAARSLSITESRKAWARGLVSSGYHVDLPLSQMSALPPDLSDLKLAVSASLDLGPGRVYSKTEIFDVELPTVPPGD